MRDRGATLKLALAAIAAAGTAVLAYAAETITYTYDPRGRLVKVEHKGSVNPKVVTNYSYDKADNRKSKTVTGAP